MLRSMLCGLMLFTLITLPPAVMADRIYNILPYPVSDGGWKLSGTITTDGTMGAIQATNILSWTWNLSSPGSSGWTVSSTDPGSNHECQRNHRDRSEPARPLSQREYRPIQTRTRFRVCHRPRHAVLSERNRPAAILGVVPARRNRARDYGVGNRVDGPRPRPRTCLAPPCGVRCRMCAYLMGKKRGARRAAAADA